MIIVLIINISSTNIHIRIILMRIIISRCRWTIGCPSREERLRLSPAYVSVVRVRSRSIRVGCRYPMPQDRLRPRMRGRIRIRQQEAADLRLQTWTCVLHRRNARGRIRLGRLMPLGITLNAIRSSSNNNHNNSSEGRR